MDGDVNGTCFAVGSYERGKGRRMEVRVAPMYSGHNPHY